MRKMFFFSRALLAQSRLRLYSSIVFVLLLLAVVSVLSMDRFEGKQLGTGLTSFSNHKKITVRQAGFFSWPKPQQKRDVDEKTVKLFFKGVRVAPNGNGIISGVARPGYNIYIKSHGEDVAVAKSAPDGGWSTIIAGILEGDSKIYELFSETPDGQFTHRAKQKLVITIPDNKMNGVVVKITEEGKVPLIVADNLPLSMVMRASAQAADVPSKRGADELSVLSSEYIDNEKGAGTVVVSGKSAKNAALQFFLNDKALGKVKADKAGNWKLSEPFAVKPHSTNKLRIQQINKSGKVLKSKTFKFAGSAKVAKENIVVSEEKKKTFWGRIKEMFIPGSKSEKEKKKEVEVAKPASEPKQEKNKAQAVPPSITVPERAPAQPDKKTLAQKVDDVGKKDRQLAKTVKSKPAQSGAINGKQPKSDLSGTVVQKKDKVESKTPQKEPVISQPASALDKSKTDKKVVKSDNKTNQKPKTQQAKKVRKTTLNSPKKSRQRQARLSQKSRLKRKSGTYRAKRKRRMKKRRLLRYSKRAAAKKRRLRMRRKRARLAIYRKRHHRRKLRRYSRRHALRSRSALTRRKYHRSRRRVAAIRRKRRIRVRRGDTLWDLARIRYGHGRYYHRIFRANRKWMKNPNRLMTNQRLFLPA